jgi:hypothetical protein
MDDAAKAVLTSMATWKHMALGVLFTCHNHTWVSTVLFVTQSYRWYPLLRDGPSCSVRQ